ncbi:MAG: tRNA (N(6)-L-threonylcarbamoyladenosine(37)-C(2))-methylthiotransferase MtaB [Syntrophales bacterium]|nr:tRNA (N(6)-L-threonylcarbamoyladenosine(37)-C(2))-methylthiotransferase MtaB [Syntrophales bacterium]MDD5640485.1 tRNA (N(6)-L-threonylcarbamoyladenosine(37)-C(2))-methylthiotransferase MtaB [Syntrophales bacterium]
MATENRKPKTENHLFCILTFGCKVNQCDTVGLSQELIAQGWQAAPEGTSPDLILVNTCTVTARADQQARQAIRRLAREYPGTPLWITGCYAQRDPEELAALPGVQAVLGNREKARLAVWLAAFPQKAPRIEVGPFALTENFQALPAPLLPGHTRPRLKIQDGCEHHCTYCIVPQVRGPRRSLPLEEVAGALEKLAAASYQEVVLTGVNLGQYGGDLNPSTDLAALLRFLSSRPRPPRLRLSSLEPQEVTPALLQELAGFPGFCPHFHLPLQSGAAPVLKAMGRDYTPEAFRDIIQEIKRLFPDAGLGMDVLVGFPGETEADFEATRSLVASLPVTYLHVFPFSPRPGTPAAEMRRVPHQEVQTRAKNMRELGQRKKRQFLEAQLGKTGEVLVEGPAARAGMLKGLSANYLRVLLPGPLDWQNRIIKVRFREIQGEALVGEVQ